MFSSLSAHTVAFVGTFLDAGHALGAHPMMLTAFISYFGALGGCMTNFSTGKKCTLTKLNKQVSYSLSFFFLGSAAMYYAPGYVERARWFKLGFQMAVFYLSIYFTVGVSWWSFLGWL